MSVGKSQTLRGETLVEVAIAITVFCVVSVVSLTLMGQGIATTQSSLELTMARNEIDAQAEALRFIHNSFLAERELPENQQQYRSLWLRLTRTSRESSNGLANEPDKIAPFNGIPCQELYNKSDTSQKSIFHNKAFVLNTRLLEPEHNNFNFNGYFGSNAPDNNYTKLMDDIIVDSRVGEDKNKFSAAPLYPRLVFSRYGSSNSNQNSAAELQDDTDHLYRQVAKAEGIWVISVRDTTSSPKVATQAADTADFYDFHIRTCWYSPGHSVPSTIGTIVRLYNPEVVEGAK